MRAPHHRATRSIIPLATQRGPSMSSSFERSIHSSRSKSRLLVTTGLSSAILLAALALPSPAFAADECGTPIAGVVTCPATGTPFGTGITYTVQPGDPVADLTINLEDGLKIDASGNYNAGIHVINSSDSGSIVISAAGTTIHTDGDRADGIFALNNNPNSTGSVTVVAGDVSTSGYRSDGIYASTNYGGSGDVSVTAGNVSVSGAGSVGIHATTQTGNITIDAASVKTTGYGSQGIYAAANYGDLTIHVGTVETGGVGSRGISAYSAGTTTITADNVTTTGAGLPGGDSDGIMAVGTAVNVNVSGAVSTSGDYSVGIYAHTNHTQSGPVDGSPNINVTAGSVSTQGFGADGIHAVNTSHYGNTNVAVGSVAVKGDYAWGIYAAAQYGNVDVKAGQIATSGYNGTGIIALANGFVTVAADNVTTTGDNAAGIHTQAGYVRLSGTTINAGTVSTSGNNSNGIEASSIYPGSTIGIDAGTVSTQGDNSKGISAVSAGSITITAGDVSTRGTGSAGIYAVGYSAAGGIPGTVITIDANSVSTSGDQAAGIVALGLMPLSTISIDASHVSTSGAQATGIYAESRSGAVQIQASDVHTKGAYSSGIVAVSTYNNVSVAADHIQTDGSSSTGIYAATNTGKVTITASDIHADGNYSTAIVGLGSSVAISTSGVISSGYIGAGIIAQSHDGGIVLHNNATVTTSYIGVQLLAEGQRSDILVDGTGSVVKTGEISHDGFDALNITGGNISITQGDITTSGSFSSGLVATVGNYSRSPKHTQDTAHLFVDLQNVTTDGYASAGIQLANNAVTGVAGTGDATAIAHGMVTTAGTSSDGISVYSANDAAKIQSNVIKTAGDFSDGIHVDGVTAIVDSKGAITTRGNNALGISAYGENGGIAINAGPITTAGIASTAIRATSAGNITISGTGQIATSGAGSAGIQVVELGRHRELSTYIPYSTGSVADDFGIYPRTPVTPAAGSTITVSAANISTTGDDADGIFVSASTGEAKITTNTVTVTGIDSIGIFAEDKAVSADTGNTSAAHGTAVSLHGFDSASLNVRGATISQSGDAVSLQGSAVTLTVASGGSIQGATNGVVIDTTPHVTPVVKYWGQLPHYYYAPDQPLPPSDPAPGKATVTNAGTIVGGTGYAITVTGGSATISNSGVISGAIKLAGGDDLVTNSGTFVATKDSDFGGGADRLVNTGVLRVAAAGAASARAAAAVPGAVTLLGLERFENDGGLVDLRNGVAGDTLTLPGDYIGSNGAKLGLDIGADGKVSDTLVVVGAATGHTGLLLNVAPSSATLSTRPVTLVQVGAGSSADAFDIANPEVGFIHYGLSYDSATRSFGLTTQVGVSVYRSLAVPRAAQAVWQKAADAWEAHMAEKRDARAAGDEGFGKRLWGQFYGGVDTLDGHREGAAGRIEEDTRQDYYGAQIGLDLAGKTTDKGGLMFGVTGSYISSKLNGRGTGDRTRFDTLSVGGYATALSGPLFANALVQYGHDWIEASNQPMGWSDKLKGDSYGAQLQLGARLGADRLYIEPVASLSYVRSDIGDIHAFDQTIDFDKRDGLRGKLGGRIGGIADLGGSKASFYLQASYVHEFKGKDGLTFLSGGINQAINGVRPGDYGQGAVGVNIFSTGRASGFIEADADVGGGVKGGGGRVGLSFKL